MMPLRGKKLRTQSLICFSTCAKKMILPYSIMLSYSGSLCFTPSKRTDMSYSNKKMIMIQMISTSTTNNSINSATSQNMVILILAYSKSPIMATIRSIIKQRIMVKDNLKNIWEMGAIKTFRQKIRYAKKIKQNRPLPNWIRYRTDNKIRYNACRRNWRRTKLNF